jgi:hypothetical protein
VTTGCQSRSFLVLLALVCACASQLTPPRLAPVALDTNTVAADISEAARRALIAWFECDECSAGELASVTKFGQAVVPLLSEAVIGGTSVAAEQPLRQSLEERWEALHQYSQTHPFSTLPGTKEEFVNASLAKFRAQYQVRAGAALAKIGGKTGQKALIEALKQPLPPYVEKSLRNSLSKIQ